MAKKKSKEVKKNHRTATETLLDELETLFAKHKGTVGIISVSVGKCDGVASMLHGDPVDLIKALDATKRHLTRELTAHLGI